LMTISVFCRDRVDRCDGRDDVFLCFLGAMFGDMCGKSECGRVVWEGNAAEFDGVIGGN
jgi:hypothetical protein